MKDQDLIGFIRNGQHDQAMDQLYVIFPQIKNKILSEGGNTEEAEDVFQDALVVFYKKVLNPKFKLTSKLSTYIYGIAYFTWKNKQRKTVPTSSIEVDFVEDEGSELSSTLEKEKKYEALDQILQTIGDKCMQLLKLFYYEKLSMEKITQQLKFSSTKSAKTQKYKCMEKAREQAKSFI